MIRQLNQFASQIVMTGSSTTVQYGVDFGFPASTIELFYDTTGTSSINFSFGSSVASASSPLCLTGEKRTFSFTEYISKMGLSTLTTTTSTAAGGAAQVRVHAWG